MNLESLPTEPDWTKYAAGLWGYAGVDRNRVVACSRMPAVRARIGHRGLYKPGFCQLPDGNLLASPCYQNDDGVFHMKIYRTSDSAESWQLVESSGADLMGKEPALTALRNGTLLLVTSHPGNYRIHRSDDEGRTWTVVELEEDLGVFRTIFEHDDGSLTLIISKNTYFDPAAPPSKAWLYRSTDDGRTWAKHADVKQWDHPVGMFDEGHAIRLDDGRLLGVGRVWGDDLIDGTPPPRGTPTPSGDETGDHMIIMESSDDGQTWTEPRPLTDYAQPHGHLLKLRDGRILCSYANYAMPYGAFAMFSSDNGQTWDKVHTVQLALSLNCYAGWPTSIQIDSGEVVTIYAITAYLEGEGVSLTGPGKGDHVCESVRWTP